VGNNTDVYGFEQALAALAPGGGPGRAAVVLGAGGVARAVVHVLLSQGYAVRVLSRSSGQGGTLAAALYRLHPGAVVASGALDHATLLEAAGRADVLVNATPLGDQADPTASPWPAEVPLPARLSVLDLVAWPAETRLVRQALDAGCRAAGGGEMLLHQAAAAFELWTERPAPLDAMRAALDRARGTR
jgi:shikimate dehydrogenase